MPSTWLRGGYLAAPHGLHVAARVPLGGGGGLAHGPLAAGLDCGGCGLAHGPLSGGGGGPLSGGGGLAHGLLGGLHPGGVLALGGHPGVGLLVCIRHMEVLLGPLLDHIFLMEVKPWLDPCFRLGRRWLGCHMVMGFSRMVRRRCCSLLGRILPGPWARLLLAVQFWVCRQMSWCSRRQGCE